MNIHRAFQRTQVVYFFECFDVHAGRTLVPPFKATAEAIRRVFKGKLHALPGAKAVESAA